MELTIAKQIVKAHGGKIWAQSWIGVFSTFAVSLPVKGSNMGQVVVSQQTGKCPDCGQPTESTGACVHIVGEN